MASGEMICRNELWLDCVKMYGKRVMAAVAEYGSKDVVGRRFVRYSPPDKRDTDRLTLILEGGEKVEIDITILPLSSFPRSLEIVELKARRGETVRLDVSNYVEGGRSPYRIVAWMGSGNADVDYDKNIAKIEIKNNAEPREGESKAYEYLTFYVADSDNNVCAVDAAVEIG